MINNLHVRYCSNVTSHACERVDCECLNNCQLRGHGICFTRSVLIPRGMDTHQVPHPFDRRLLKHLQLVSASVCDITFERYHMVHIENLCSHAQTCLQRHILSMVQYTCMHTYTHTLWRTQSWNWMEAIIKFEMHKLLHKEQFIQKQY